MSYAARIYDRDNSADPLDLMLALAEQAMRACVEAGAGAALRARAERVLPHAAPQYERPALSVPASERPSIAGFDELQLATVLGALKVARTARLSGDSLAQNMRARELVLGAMRALAQTDGVRR